MKENIIFNDVMCLLKKWFEIIGILCLWVFSLPYSESLMSYTFAEMIQSFMLIVFCIMCLFVLPIKSLKYDSPGQYVLQIVLLLIVLYMILCIGVSLHDGKVFTVVYFAVGWIFTNTILIKSQHSPKLKKIKEISVDYNTQRRIAIHEAGHVIAAHHLGIPILKVEISSGDGRMIMKNSVLVLDKDIKNQIVINYAGTAAEELFFPDINSPALEYEDSDFAKSISQIKDYLIMTGSLSKSGTEHDAGDMIAKTSDEMYKLSKEILVNERTKLESLSELLLYRGSLSNTDIQDFFLKNEM